MHFKSKDIEKVCSNWVKTLGLYYREEYSLSIVRSAVTIELALNYAIRNELSVKHGLPEAFVNKHLMLANGIKGKLDRLYLPILEGTELESDARESARAIEKLNKQRNDIAHRGEFKEKSTAIEFLSIAEKEINFIVGNYDSNFILDKFDSKRSCRHRIYISSSGGATAVGSMRIPGEKEG